MLDFKISRTHTDVHRMFKKKSMEKRKREKKEINSGEFLTKK